MSVPSENLLTFLSKVLKQSGVGAIFAVVTAYALVHVYADLKERNHLLIEVVRDSSRESREVSSALRELSSVIARMDDRRSNDP